MSAKIRFELRFEVDVPVEDGDDPRDYVTQQQKTQLEKEVLKALHKKLYGEVVDIEVMDTTIIADESNPREPGDDDGREYADPRDAREEWR